MDIITEVDIEASAAQVWDALTDFASYPHWNPMIRRISGQLREGARLRLWVAAGVLQVPMDAELITVDPERELRWVGPPYSALRRVACGDHYFLLEPQGDNRVRVRHNEEYSGLIVPTRLPPVYNTLRSAYEGFNRALKQWVESRA